MHVSRAQKAPRCKMCASISCACTPFTKPCATSRRAESFLQVDGLQIFNLWDKRASLLLYSLQLLVSNHKRAKLATVPPRRPRSSDALASRSYARGTAVRASCRIAPTRPLPTDAPGRPLLRPPAVTVTQIQDITASFTRLLRSSGTDQRPTTK